MPSVLIHIQNEDPVLGEVDELPGASDTIITVKNPRKRDGKDLAYLDPSVTTVIWPFSRINFIEVMLGEEEEDIITFVRE
ncbi:MAG: hypothetical protein IT308_03225 [Anaerolineaceae bacterium]|nr:hypothetical protein [Anaerolineaceae bacterium]